MTTEPTKYLSIDPRNDITCKNLLVLKGSQSVAKTPWVKGLMAKDIRGKYIATSRTLKTSNSMSALACVKYLFVELGEMGQSFKKTDINDIGRVLRKFKYRKDTKNTFYNLKGNKCLHTTIFTLEYNS